MSTKLYHHKTDGGAEYLTDTFIAWRHNGKSGKEGTITDKTTIIVRIDGDITKDAEINGKRVNAYDELRGLLAQILTIPALQYIEADQLKYGASPIKDARALLTSLE